MVWVKTQNKRFINLDQIITIYIKWSKEGNQYKVQGTSPWDGEGMDEPFCSMYTYTVFFTGTREACEEYLEELDQVLVCHNIEQRMEISRGLKNVD